MNCPYCNQELEPIGTSGQFQCGNLYCEKSWSFIATKNMWQELSKIKQSLVLALDSLKYIAEEQTPAGKFARITLSDIEKITKN